MKINIKEIRKEKKISQTQLAIKVGVSLSSIRMWEMGVTTPTEENHKKLLEALEITK